MVDMNRREFIKTTGAVAGATVGASVLGPLANEAMGKVAAKGKPVVALIHRDKLPQFAGNDSDVMTHKPEAVAEVEKMIEEAFNKSIGGVTKLIKPKQKVFIKPNCFANVQPNSYASMDPRTMEAICRVIKKAVPNCYLQVGDAPSLGQILGESREALKNTKIEEASKRGGADEIELATRQRRFEDVRDIEPAFAAALACSHNRVNFIDKQNLLVLPLSHFLQDLLNAFLEFAPVFRASDERVYAELHDPLAPERFGHLASSDTLRQTFYDCCLSHPGLADQHGIVLRPAIEDLHAPSDFFVPADYRIKLALASHLQKIDPITFQCFIFVLRILVCYFFRASDFFQGTLNLFRRNRVEL